MRDKPIKNALLPYDTSTGKTAIALEYYIRYHLDVPLMIVAPPSKIKEGGWQNTVEILEKYHDISVEYEIVSYYVLHKNIKKGYFIVFDECHYVKSSTNRMGKSAYALSKLSVAWIFLSGTPMANGFKDSINYLKMNGLVKNKTDFIKKYAIMDKYYGIGDFKAGAEEEISEMIAEFSLPFVSKEDCIDLPPILYQDIVFNKSKDYKTLFKDRVLNDEIYDTTAKLNYGLRTVANLKDKCNWVNEFLQGTNNNVVIFYNFNAELDALLENIPKETKIFTINGKINNAPVMHDTETIKNLKNSVTLVQYQAGSTGIELHYANEVIMFSPTFSYTDYYQALGRCYRAGQEKKVTVYFFKTKGTIENKVYYALEKKQDFSDEMFSEYIKG